jgi:hypothetical protein
MLSAVCGNVNTLPKYRIKYGCRMGHMMWMYDKRTPKRILEWKPIRTRIRGRPRKRWIVDIEEDMQIMGIRQWRKQCKERAEWKRITAKRKAHNGL